MTTAELIAELQKYVPDTIVWTTESGDIRELDMENVREKYATGVIIS